MFIYLQSAVLDMNISYIYIYSLSIYTHFLLLSSADWINAALQFFLFWDNLISTQYYLPTTSYPLYKLLKVLQSLLPLQVLPLNTPFITKVNNTDVSIVTPNPSHLFLINLHKFLISLITSKPLSVVALSTNFIASTFL